MSYDMHVKIDEMNSDVLIADVIRKFNFRKINLLYLPILYGDLYSNLVSSIVPQISCIIQKIKKIYNAKNSFSRKQHFSSLKIVRTNQFNSIIIFVIDIAVMEAREYRATSG